MVSPIVWRSLLVVSVAGLLLGILLASSPFPPGADPGHMLALSYALEGNGPEGKLGYAPALPFLMLVVRRIANGDTSLLMQLVKALGLLCLLAEAGGLAAFAGAVAGRSAAQWTFVLAAWNPNSWNQLLWGGYAQMLAIGLGGCGLALLARHRFLLSGSLLGGVVLTHPYSAIFFSVAGMALGSALRSWGALLTAGMAALVALPSIPAHSHFLREVSFGRAAEGYAVSLAEIAQNVVFHPAIDLLMGSLLALALAARKPVVARIWPFLSACGVLLLLTPPLHVARAGLFAWHGAVLYMGISFAQRRASRIAMAAMCLTPIVSFADLTTLLRDYAPLEAKHAEAMIALAAAADGRALIVSPAPNVDGWWYEGLTGKPALIGDDLRWALMREQQERSVAAQTIAQATRVRDGGPLRLLTLELPGRADVTSLWVKDVEFFPLIETRRPDGSHAYLTPAQNVRVHHVTRDGDSIELGCEFFYDWYRWKGFRREVVIEVAAEGLWSAEMSTEVVRIEGPALTLRFGDSGSDRNVEELQARWNVSHVWVRSKPDALERFELDERFEKMWQDGDVTTFRVRGRASVDLP